MSREPIKPRGLGRGLAALLGDDTPPPAPETTETPAATPTPTPSSASIVPTTTLPIDWLQSGKYQPRRAFDEEGLVQLAESITAHGLVQPILVRPLRGPDGAAVPQRYEIVAGERRWRAAQRARLHEVPVVIKALADRDALEIALIENVQRADLTPIEEATAYRRLQSEFGHTQERIGVTVGKSRAHIANTLRLLELPDDVVAMLADHRLDAGSARALLGTPDPTALAHYGVNHGLTTRDFEHLARLAKDAAARGWSGQGMPPGWSVPGKKPPARRGARPRKRPNDADTLALERSLGESLGLHVVIEHVGPAEQSRLIILLETYDQLDLVSERLSRR